MIPIRPLSLIFGVLLSHASEAFVLGSPQLISPAGSPTLVRVPVTLDKDETSVKAEIAPESVFSALGYFYPQSLRNAVVRYKSGMLEISGGRAPKGDVLPIVLEIATNRGSVVRHFSVDLPKADSEALREQIKPVVVPDAPVKRASTGNSTAHLDVLMQQRIDALQRTESEMSTRLKLVEGAIAQTLTKVDLAVNNTNHVLEATESRAGRNDVLFLGGATIVGFLLAASLLGGRGSLSSGTRVRLVGYGKNPIEGEFVRMISDEKKPLPYRIADRIVGVPRMVEFRAFTSDSAIGDRASLPSVENISAGSLQIQSETPVEEARLELVKPCVREDVANVQMQCAARGGEFKVYA